MPASSIFLPALLGFGTSLSLIVAIGAQNAYVLRLGIVARKRVMLPVVIQCALSDAVLIVAGTLGIGVLIRRAPLTLLIVRVVGACFLVAYGLLSARKALRPAPESMVVDTSDAARGISVGAALAAVAAFTWLNPHVYLDTVVFLGSVANQQGHAERWWWVGGAAFASLSWFFALGFGSRLLRPLFARPLAWRVLDGIIAAVMVFLGVKIAIGF